MLLYIILAILGGVTIVLSRSVNGIFAQKTNVYQSTLMNYVTGLIGSLVLVFVYGQLLQMFQPATYQGPWWAYTGGLIGIITVSLSAALATRISAFYLTVLIFIGQMFTGMIIDYITTREFSLMQLLGGLLVLIGLVYNMSIDKHSKKEN